jgi:hypothetical protein
MADVPLLIHNDCCRKPFIVEEPELFSDVLFDGCRQKTVYLCGPFPAVFITHCTDLAVFICTTPTFHVSCCANGHVLAAVQMIPESHGSAAAPA